MESNWRKSSYSGSNGGECIKVASTSGSVLVRDTTNRSGPVLAFTTDAWLAFVLTVE
jgi:cobalamin biosynthesis protein CobT